jgi:hypothetical protein
VHERLVRRLLRDEAEQGRDAGHRQGGQRRDAGEHGQPAPQAGQQPQVTGAGLVVDDPDGQEQGGLEQPVRQEQGAPGERRLAGAGPDQHEQEAELADGPKASSA